jgi:hypothetical protein
MEQIIGYCPACCKEGREDIQIFDRIGIQRNPFGEDMILYNCERNHTVSLRSVVEGEITNKKKVLEYEF